MDLGVVLYQLKCNPRYFIKDKTREIEEVLATATLSSHPQLVDLEKNSNGYKVKLEINEWENGTLEGEAIRLYSLKLRWSGAVPVEEYERIWESIEEVLKESRSEYFKGLEGEEEKKKLEYARILNTDPSCIQLI